MNYREELQFLPAVLEIQETPPLPASRLILWGIMLFFGLALLWACCGQVDIVGIAAGKIIPSARVKVIQPLESGVVKRVLVEEGQMVKAGELLVQLDNTVSGADQSRLVEQKHALQLERARLLGLLKGLRPGKAGNAADALALVAPPAQAESGQLRMAHQQLTQQFAAYRSRVRALDEEISERTQERNAITERIEQLDATIPLISERARAYATLTRKNLIPRVQWLELEQERIEQHKERDVQTNRFAMVSAAINNIRERQRGLRAEFTGQLLEETAAKNQEITAIDKELVKAGQRVRLERLTAPVDGTVQQLSVHTVGGVVTPAQQLMLIVPEEDALEVEAWVENKDIGFVHAGQSAEIKIETFPFTRYGTINGELMHISTDAVADERRGLVYRARVRMQSMRIWVKNKFVRLVPGMLVHVEVKMGRRRIIEYLLSPLLRYQDESIRER